MLLNHHDSELTKHLIVEKDNSTATPGSVCSKSEATAHTKSIEDRQSEMQRRLEHRASLPVMLVNPHRALRLRPATISAPGMFPPFVV